MGCVWKCSGLEIQPVVERISAVDRFVKILGRPAELDQGRGSDSATNLSQVLDKGYTCGRYERLASPHGGGRADGERDQFR